MLPFCYLFALLGHVALWVEFNNRTHGLGWPRKLVDGLTLASGFLFFFLPSYAALRIAKGTPPKNPFSTTSDWLAWYGLICLMMATIWIITRISLKWDREKDDSVQTEEIEILDLTTRTPCLDSLKGIIKNPLNEMLRLQVEHRTHPIANLPKGLEGLKIAHLTDFHMSGRIGREYFEAVVERVNAWQADLVCLTGDLIEHTAQLDWIETTLERLESRLGNFFILGNHDAKIDHELMRQRIVEAGLIDVGGCHKTVTDTEGASIILCGDERPWIPGEAAPLPYQQEALILGLIHSPDRFDWAVANDVQLVLAGHNHGGQICFPLIGPLLCPSRHGVRYASGSFRRGKTAMHVSRGTSSLFPIRYLCPPELGLITLTKAEA